jgi:hypothetical protein
MPPGKRKRYARVVQGRKITPTSIQSQAGKVRLPGRTQFLKARVKSGRSASHQSKMAIREMSARKI